MTAHKWCAIDAEGDRGDKGLLGVAFYTESGGSYQTDHSVITDLIYSFAERGYTFIAHNAEYDLSVIFWQLGIPMKAVYFSGRFNRGEWQYDPDKPLCQLWDTLALSGGLSLKKLGVAMSLSKYETPQRLRGIDPNRYNWTCDEHRIGECEECYAVRDAEICYRFMCSLTDQLTAWGVTPHRRLSGLAAHVWRKLDNPDPIGIKNPKIRGLARQSYHGGRTETFKLGTVSPCHTADVTSMYPWAMLNTPYPDPEHMIYVERPHINGWFEHAEGCADVDITVPAMYLPPLPVSYRGQLHYPIGRFRGCFTLLELRYAVATGSTIHKIHAAAYSQETLAPFTSFIGTLWAMREAYKSTNDPRQLFAKLLLNNLYGYLGMRDDLVRTDIGPAVPNVRLKRQPKTQWYTSGGELFLTYERPQPKRNAWTNVMWASQTTAAARVKLHQLMMMQGQSLIYCDTDSVFSMMPIQGLSDGLGGLRSEGTYQSIIVSAPKLYALQDFGGTWKATAKGVSKMSALTFLREGEATFKAPIKPMSQQRRQIPAGTWVDMTRQQRFTPSRRQPLDAAALLSDGGWSDTSPVVVVPDGDALDKPM